MKERLEKIRSDIRSACAEAGRAESSVKLIAVSKTKPAADIAAFVKLGVKDFGENYIQEALLKVDALRGEDLDWHFIGKLQSNKAKFVPGIFSLLHTLDSTSLADKLNKAAASRGLTQACLIEVNVSGEGSKGGITPKELPLFLEKVTALGALNIKGLMCIPAPGAGRRAFAELRELLEFANHAGAYPRPLTELSMGMSGDFREAILEGSTMVRVGTALFGERK